jgi:hypothetical protein
VAPRDLAGVCERYGNGAPSRRVRLASFYRRNFDAEFTTTGSSVQVKWAGGGASIVQRLHIRFIVSRGAYD